MNPQYNEKNPISVIIYLIDDKSPIDDLSHFSFWKINIKPNANKIEPCIMSPNITPNKNGKVTQVNRPGLAYLYLGTP
jgi:hypothetical protein